MYEGGDAPVGVYCCEVGCGAGVACGEGELDSVGKRVGEVVLEFGEDGGGDVGGGVGGEVEG